MALVRVWTERERPDSGSVELLVGGERFEPLPDAPGVDLASWRCGFPVPSALLDSHGGGVRLVLGGGSFDVAPPVDPRVAALEEALETARADSREALVQFEAERRRTRDTEQGLRAALAARDAALSARDAELASLRAAVASGVDEVERVRREHASAAAHGERLRAEVEALRLQAAAGADRLRAAESALSEREADFARNAEEAAAARAAAHERSVVLGAVRDALDAAEADLAEAREGLGARDEELARSRKALEEVGASAERFRGSAEASEAARLELAARVDELTAAARAADAERAD